MADFGKTLVNFGKEVLFDSLPEAIPVLKLSLIHISEPTRPR